jgi:PAS domain S-box-containing protein
VDIPEEPLTTKDGAMRYVHAQKIPIAGGEGAPRYLLGIATDITSLKQAQDERRLFFTHALDLLCIADLDGQFLQINPAFETTLGYPMAELLHRPFIDFVHPDDVEATQAATARLAEGRDVVAFENRYVCKDGSYRWLLWSATADPVARRIYAAARDVTERRELERQVIQIGTAEQERIAHDLHDGLGQTLTGLALKAQMAFYDLTDVGKPEAAARALAIVDLANQASAQSRALARGLDPVMLEEGLPAALQDLAQATSELFAVPCTFETDRFDTRIDKFDSNHLYRIAQEAVNNAARHARPSTISVALTSRGGQLSLTVSDDGRGFDGSAGRTEGMGLRNMRYRARMIGAVVSILANAKGGTTVICTLQRTPADGHRAPAGREGEPP